jgi:hypothetical protein
MNQHQKFLTDIFISTQALRKAKEIYADRIAPDFLFFDFLRDDEISLSRCLHNLLDVKGTHAQGTTFLQLFLDRFVKFDWAKSLSLKNIVLEQPTDASRRIDIYLQFDDGEIIAIENKPWASDQKNQLKDYAEYIEAQSFGKNWHLIYLCNNEASEESLPECVKEKLESKGRYSNLDYKNLLDWLESCYQHTKAPIVEIFIKELIRFIRVEINGELEMSEQKEMSQLILSSPENLQSAFQILQAIDPLKEELLVKLRIELEQSVKAAGFLLVWDDSMAKGWKSYSGFGIKFKEEHNLYLRFEFAAPWLTDLYWGIRRETASVNKNPEIWTKLNEVVRSKFTSGKPSTWWPWWSWVEDSTDWGADMSDWYANYEPWALIDSGELVKKIMLLVIKMHDALKENQHLLRA